MDIFTALSGPLIGMFGVILGTLLNEFLRRGRRVEEYSSVIFAKRLQSYEALLRLIQDGSEIADEVISNPELSPEERHELIDNVIRPIALHVDRNVLYIDGELGDHCVALFMGTEDIHDAPESDKHRLLKEFYQMRTETYRMIREDAGVAQINKLFHSINRSKITSPVIERIRELRQEQRKSK